ncbi:MAG: SCO family protein [Ktedonobacteraceae bacterium]|nr:SCO family protein [Ktedonobacteraceae bacterium]
MHINWRLASRLSVVTLAVLVVILVTLLQQQKSSGGAAPGAAQTDTRGSSASSSLQGASLGNRAAPDFRLTDQYGKEIALSQFKGKPVVLTFMYTSCPDFCPLTAEKLHTAMQSLNQEAQNVGILAVSVDPQHDTIGAALKFSQAHNMQNYWHYLVGPREKLAPVWTAYNIYAIQPQSHSLGVYLIDKQGNERVFLDSDFTADQLAKDLQILLKE